MLDQTQQALARMTDEGLFERVAHGALRVGAPEAAGLAHLGVNAEGRTRKAPIDGFEVIASDPPHLVMAHHTITQPDKLRSKWLHDPSTVTPRKRGGKPTAPAGDVVKTAEIVAKERNARRPDTRATLFLTTNEEADEALIRDVAAAGAKYGIDIKIWSRSKIAHVLDHTSQGQSIRRALLGLTQTLVSPDLLEELSKRSLAEQYLPDDPRARVTRGLDELLRRERRELIFLVAESGRGKSVACRKLLEAHIRAGGYGVVLTEDLVQTGSPLEETVLAALRRLHPALAEGQDPFAANTPENPFLIIVEDINLSERADRLALRLLGWAAARAASGSDAGARYRIICPLWPETLGRLNEQNKKTLEKHLLVDDGFTPAEGAAATLARASLAGVTLSQLAAEEISDALGHDALMIALRDPDAKPDPARVFDDFLEGALQRASSAHHSAGDLRAALVDLGASMLAKRCVSDPDWAAIARWPLEANTFQAIADLTKHGEVVRRVGLSTAEKLRFRHDRLREYVLALAAADRMSTNSLADDLWADPLLAEILALAMLQRNADASILAKLSQANPLALFEGLRRSPAGTRASIAQACQAWISQPDATGAEHYSLRQSALSVLAQTDAPEVCALVAQFPEQDWLSALARLRNGDLGGGIAACLLSMLGSVDPTRDLQIAHARAKFEPAFSNRLDECLRDPTSAGNFRAGALLLAGYLGAPCLEAAIAASWDCDPERDRNLAEYLWAFARCCTDDTAQARLGPVCAAWAELSDTINDVGISPRNMLAALGIRFAFQIHPPASALSYLVARASQSDLKSEIAGLLEVIDHPKAIDFVLANPETNGPSEHWRRVQAQGRPMSQVTRDHLRSIWTREDAPKVMRRKAFTLWSASVGIDDLEVLTQHSQDPVLTEDILKARVTRGDPVVRDLVFERLMRRPAEAAWWRLADGNWSPGYDAALVELLSWVAGRASLPYFEEEETTRLAASLVAGRPQVEAEGLLLGHWAALKGSPTFVRTALLIATPLLQTKAAKEIGPNLTPSSVFKYLIVSYGLARGGRFRPWDPAQIEALAPYLKHLSAGSISFLANACNDAGWFELRAKLFDPLKGSRDWRWADDIAFGRFNMLTRQHGFSPAQEIKDALQRGATWSELVDQLRRWLRKTRTPEAAVVMAIMIGERGDRGDVAVLEKEASVLDPVTQAVVANTVFLVHRRSTA